MLNISPQRDMLIALTGRTVSVFGDEVALVALTLRLQADGARPYQVALMLAAGALPLLLLSRPAGRLADSRDSRHLLVGAGLAQAACTIPLVFVHSVAVIVVLVMLMGAAALLASATWSALVPRIVGDDHVAGAVSATQSLNALAAVAGPALGGLLAGAFGTGLPLIIDAASFAAVTLAAGLVRTRRAPAAKPAGPGPDGATAARGGFAILRADPVLATLFGGLAVLVLLVGMVDVVLVYLVRDTLHASGTWFGIAGSAWIAGLVAGSVGAGRIRTGRTRIWAVVAGAGLACAPLAAFAVVPAVWLLVPLSVLGGTGNGYAGVCASTLLATRVPDAERGRASAAANAAVGGAQGLSLLAGGAISVVLSPRAVYAAAGLLGVAVALAMAAAVAAAGRRREQARRRLSASPAAAAPAVPAHSAALR